MFCGKIGYKNFRGEHVERKKDSKEYIMIKKETLVNVIFAGIFTLLALFVAFAMYTNIMSAVNKSNEAGLDSSLIAYKDDTFLNVIYPYPGGNWVEGTLDTSGIEEVVNESMGEDAIFDINSDVLTEEVISSICFNDEGLEGYRQFMSFTFRPTVETKNDTEFLSYCEESFKKDIENSGDYVSYNLVSSSMDGTGGVLMKLELVEKITTRDEEGNDKESEEIMYYTQYIKNIGVNTAIVTFGSIAEDSTVDAYLSYFLNNIVSTLSLH